MWQLELSSYVSFVIYDAVHSPVQPLFIMAETIYMPLSRQKPRGKVENKLVGKASRRPGNPQNDIGAL